MDLRKDRRCLAPVAKLDAQVPEGDYAPLTMLDAPAAMSASQKIADRPGHDAELLNVTQGGAWCLGLASEEDGEALRAHGGERLVSKL